MRSPRVDPRSMRIHRPWDDTELGLEWFAGMEEVCLGCWLPLYGRRRKWCRSCTSYWFEAERNIYTDWNVVRWFAFERDNWTCRKCGRKAGKLMGRPTDQDDDGNTLLEADHIVEIARGGAVFDLNNIQTLCHPCHVDKTNNFRRAKYRVPVTAKPLEAYA